jgi:hypothetical protein
MSNLALATRPHICNNVHAHNLSDSSQSPAWIDYQDEWVERRTGEILGDHERDLSEVIGDYCDTTTTSLVLGLKVNRWQEYERAIRAAMDESPCFRDFMEKAAMMQAEKDFGEIVRQ